MKLFGKDTIYPCTGLSDMQENKQKKLKVFFIRSIDRNGTVLDEVLCRCERV